MTGVAILVPALRRPRNVAPLLASIQNTTPEPWRAIFIVEPADRATHRAVAEHGAELIRASGSYASKINLAARMVHEPLLFLAADDLRFHPHWLERARARMRGAVMVVGTNDLGNPRVTSGRHATHSLVHRDYLEQGTIDGEGLLHEGYRHWYCDDEFVATARRRRAWAFAHDSIVEHLHPNWGKAQMDPIYERGQSHAARDRITFRRRRRLWT